jgi:hypothetical protein
MSADELRLKTVAVPVHLAVGPHDTWYERGEVFLADETSTRQLFDALAELLESSVQFIPFRTGERVRLVAKTAIVYVAIPGEIETPAATAEAELVLYDRQHRVEVLLVQGTRFEGLLLDNSPAAHPRAIDHLNSAKQFVRLWTASEQVLISKAQIATVAELGEP